MTPAVPLLDPLPLPAPVWLLSALLSLTFTLHLVAMNLLLGGSSLAAVARWRARYDTNAAAFSRYLAAALPVVFAAAVTLGVAALLFLQVLYGRVFFPGAVLLAVPWILIVPLVIAAYYGTYWLASEATKERFKKGPGTRDEGRGEDHAVRGARSAHGALATLDPPVTARGVGFGVAAAVSAIVLVIAFVQANVMSLLLRPAAFSSMFFTDASGLAMNLRDATLAPRFLHVVFGATAVAGLAVATGGFLLRNREPELSPWMLRHGAMTCVAATVINILPGFWWLAALPSGQLVQFMGRNLAATLWLAGGILAALAAVGHIIPAAMVKPKRSLISGAAISMLVALLCMVQVRDIARQMSLAPQVLPPATWVEPQWGAIALFLVLLLAALGLVWWMVRALIRGRAV